MVCAWRSFLLPAHPPPTGVALTHSACSCTPLHHRCQAFTWVTARPLPAPDPKSPPPTLSGRCPIKCNIHPHTHTRPPAPHPSPHIPPTPGYQHTEIDATAAEHCQPNDAPHRPHGWAPPLDSGPHCSSPHTPGAATAPSTAGRREDSIQGCQLETHASTGCSPRFDLCC